MRKEAWRCRSWDEVKKRAACIDILSPFASAPAGPDDNAVAEVANNSSARSAGRRGKEVARPCTIPRTLELYCGRAGYSSHQKKMGNSAFFLDWNKEYVQRSFAPMPDYDEGGQVLTLNGLDERSFIHLDFLDFAMVVITKEIDVGNLHAIHDGLDCTTFTDMAVSNSERIAANAFFGTSPEAFATNLRCDAPAMPGRARPTVPLSLTTDDGYSLSRLPVCTTTANHAHTTSHHRYHYLMAFHLFLHQQGQTDLCVRTGENPKATRQFHPLTTGLMEQPKAQGGLGMVKVTLSYCQTTSSPFQAFQKDTNLWADYAGILELFVDTEGACIP